jgi:hypothetical protein
MEFGNDFVLALELVAQRGDGALEVALGRGAGTLEGGRAVLEERLLPEREKSVGESWYASLRSETGTRSIRWRRRMATFSTGV